MAGSVPFTPQGFARLVEEVKRLREIERPMIVTELAAAEEHGDLKENAEYHAAKEKLAIIDKQIDTMSRQLSAAEIIDPSKITTNKIAFGATVKLSNTDTGEEVEYRIVGPAEADLKSGSKSGSISIESPVARSLIGRVVGDEVTVRTPGGVRSFEVLSIVYR